MWNRLFVLAMLVFAIALLGGANAAYTFTLQPDFEYATIGWNNHSYIARSSDGNIYAVFLQARNNLVITKSTDDGYTWSTQLKINEPVYGAAATAPNVVIDPNNKIHVAFAAGGPGEIYYRSCQLSSGIDCLNIANWSAQSAITSTPGNSLFPLLDIDAAGKLHLVWNENDLINYKNCSASCGNIGNWSADLNVGDAIDPANQFYPSLVISGNNLYVAWENWDDATGSVSDIYYAQSVNSGASWSAPINIGNDAGASENARLVIDSAGTLHAVWENYAPVDYNGMSLSYKNCPSASVDCSTYSNWSAGTDVSTLAAGDYQKDASLIVDGSNNLYVFYRDLRVADGNEFGLYDIKFKRRSASGTWNFTAALTNAASGYGGISCTNKIFSATYQKLDCIWTVEDSNLSNTITPEPAIMFFSIVQDVASFSSVDIGSTITTNTDLKIVPVSLPSGTHTLDIQELRIYSPNAFGAGTLLPWYYEFSTDMANNTFNLTLVFSYRDADQDGKEDVTGTAETSLYIAYWDGTQWKVKAGVINTTANTITISATSFSQYALVSLPPVGATLNVTPKKKNIKEDGKFDFVVHITSAEDLSRFADAAGASFSNSSYTLTGINYDASKNQLDMKIDAGTLQIGNYEFNLLSIGEMAFSTNSDYATVFKPGKK